MGGMSTRPNDTSAPSWHAQRGILARMDPASRVRIAIDLSDSVRELQIQGILIRNPAWSRTDAVASLIQRMAGPQAGQA
jgi:hypothetical protein